MINKKKLIIDTDPGHDDALALMLAYKSNLFDILAITTVCGNSTIENTTKNCRYIMNLLDSKIPIYSGAKKPLKKGLIKAVVHGESGLAGIDPELEPKLNGKAVSKIISLIEKYPNEITLVTLGPLTNIAKVFKKRPDLISKINELVLMGGAIREPGNKNRVAEFNIFVDPDAADIVLNASVNKTIMVPLDICNKVGLQLSDFEKIKNDKIKEVVLAMMKPYITNIENAEGIKAALMYDPLTVYYLINPDAYVLESHDVKVETKSDLTRGMAVADLRIKSEKKFNVNVVSKVDIPAFTKDFIEILSRK